MIRSITLVISFTISLFFLNTAHAANPCKGLESSTCKSSNACIWVNGYQRSDGKTVKAYCRKSAKKSTTSPNQKQQPSTVKPKPETPAPSKKSEPSKQSGSLIERIFC